MDKKFTEDHERDFTIFINALSVGWHLRKIVEAESTIIWDDKDFSKLLDWLEKHQLSPKE